ncbi:YrhK family protein [Prauserella alba]|uniref:YrhK domain-containing protein n=1 Tax=Prauserella alba TaxID=176898 RepID=A0ABP4FWW1_9PSEU|nr:YrhK family protein [Prauserella alba]MCP2179621.1 YrhK-like protein [Prauserella alba]
MADEDPGPLHIRIGDEELLIRRRYEVASIVNDLLIALWFTIGSVLFFSDSTEYAGTWLFLIGSVQLMIRPAIRLRRRIHLRRFRSGRPTEASHDF